MAAMIAEAKKRWGRIDILHYNVGVSLAGGDAPLAEITEAAFDNVVAINLRGAVMACKHVIPVMREQKSGVDPDDFLARRARELSLRRLQGEQVGDDRLHQAGGDRERRLRHPRQRHPARPDGHADGGGHARAQDRQEPRRSRRDARRARAAAAQDGHRLGRRQRGAVPRLGRGQLHHRRGPAGGRRRRAGSAESQACAGRIAPATRARCARRQRRAGPPRCSAATATAAAGS